MNPEQLASLLEYRLEQARETLREAQILAIDSKMARDAIADAETFIAAIETYLRATGSLGQAE